MTFGYLKVNVHFEFDKLWQEGLMSRRGAYRYLQFLMGIVNHADAHISRLSYGELGALLQKLRRPSNLKAFFVFCNGMNYKYTKPNKEKKLPDRFKHMRHSPYAPFVSYDERHYAICKMCGVIGTKLDVKPKAGCIDCRVKKANRKLRVLHELT